MINLFELKADYLNAKICTAGAVYETISNWKKSENANHTIRNVNDTLKPGNRQHTFVA